MVRRKEIITFFKVGGETLEEEGAFELRVRSHRLRIRGRTSVSSVIFGEDNRVLYVYFIKKRILSKKRYD